MRSRLAAIFELLVMVDGSMKHPPTTVFKGPKTGGNYKKDPPLTIRAKA